MPTAAHAPNPGWKTVRDDVVDVVDAVDAIRVRKKPKADVNARYKASLKKILIIMATSAAAAALIVAGFRRHPDIAKKYWSAAKSVADEETVTLAQVAKAQVVGKQKIPFTRNHEKLYVNDGKFNASRLSELQAVENKTLNAVRKRHLSASEGLQVMWNAFRVTDPPNVRTAMIKHYAARSNASEHGGRTFDKRWNSPERVYEKFVA